MGTEARERVLGTVEPRPVSGRGSWGGSSRSPLPGLPAGPDGQRERCQAAEGQGDLPQHDPLLSCAGPTEASSEPTWCRWLAGVARSPSASVASFRAGTQGRPDGEVGASDHGPENVSPIEGPTIPRSQIARGPIGLERREVPEPLRAPGPPYVRGRAQYQGFQPAPTAIASAARLASARMILRSMCASPLRSGLLRLPPGRRRERRGHRGGVRVQPVSPVLLLHPVAPPRLRCRGVIGGDAMSPYRPTVDRRAGAVPGVR